MFSKFQDIHEKFKLKVELSQNAKYRMVKENKSWKIILKQETLSFYLTVLKIKIYSGNHTIYGWKINAS